MSFSKKWYTNEGNPLKESIPFTMEESLEYDELICEEIEKRGLIYHVVGHVWTC
jgi:hypothetical protein